jgi:hypothetical protein
LTDPFLSLPRKQFFAPPDIVFKRRGGWNIPAGGAPLTNVPMFFIRSEAKNVEDSTLGFGLMCRTNAAKLDLIFPSNNMLIFPTNGM